MTDSVNGDHHIIKSKYSYALLDDTTLQHSEVPFEIKIMDSRKLKDFKQQVLGGYSKTQVLSSFDTSIREEKYDHSIYWALQLLCSGSAEATWERLTNIAAKTINLLNPTLPTFLLTRTKDFNKIISQPRYKGEASLTLRNNNDIRLMIVELTIMCATSRRSKLDTLPSIKKTDFMVDVFKSRLEAKDTNISEEYMKENDPSEVRIAANELAYNLYHKNLSKAIYWLAWIVEWAKLNTKKYSKFEIGIRAQSDIDAKFYRLWCWLPWYIIIGLSRQTQNTSIITEIGALWDLYKLEFSASQCTRKMSLMIWAMKLLTTPCDWKLKLIEKEPVMFHQLMNINAYFKNLKTQCTVDNTPKELDKFNLIIQDNYIKPPKAKVIAAVARKQPSLSEGQKRQQAAFALDKFLI
jgi:hypothetical protein